MLLIISLLIYNNLPTSMRKIFLLSFIVIFFSFGKAQEQNEQADLQNRIRQQASMKQTACLVLSRYHTNSHKNIVEQVIGSLPPLDQQPYINKLYAVAIEKCLPNIRIQQAQQFFIQNNQFDPSEMFYLLDGINYYQVSNDLTLSQNQKNIVKFIKQFDAQMEVRKQQKEATEGAQGSDDEIGIFGIPVQNFNSLGGYAYIIVLLSLVIGGLVWGFSELQNSSIKKKRKSKSKGKQSKGN